MKKIQVKYHTFEYNEQYITSGEALDMVSGMIYKVGGSHPDTVQQMLKTCAKIRSDPAWQVDDLEDF